MDALSIQDLHKVYADGFVALKGINLRVAQGDFFALLGANGAGKTTTLGIVSSLINKTRGTITICGDDLDRARSRAKMHLGVVPQEFNFNNFEKVIDIVMQQAGYYGLAPRLARQRTEYYLRKLELWDKRDKKSVTLSGGMKRRLMIARALVHEPQLLILDEPTAGVDIEMRRTMWAFLREINHQGKTIILTTHYFEEAEQLCRNIAIIDQGEIIANTSKRELLQRMDKQIYVAEVEDLPETLPNDTMLRCACRKDGTLELVIDKSQSLNQAMERLTAAGVRVMSIRPRHNRLEELFINLTNHNAV